MTGTGKNNLLKTIYDCKYFLNKKLSFQANCSIMVYHLFIIFVFFLILNYFSLCISIERDVAPASQLRQFKMQTMSRLVLKQFVDRRRCGFATTATNTTCIAIVCLFVCQKQQTCSRYRSWRICPFIPYIHPGCLGEDIAWGNVSN